MRFLFGSVAFGFIVACGGTAIVDPPSADGGGGTGGSPTTTTSTTTSSSGGAPSTSSSGGAPNTSSVGPSTSTGPAVCGDLESCCFELCPLLQDLPCYPMGDCGCTGIGQGFEEPCASALATLYQCLIATNAVGCSQFGDPAVVCGPCDVELDLIEDACGGGIGECI